MQRLAPSRKSLRSSESPLRPCAMDDLAAYDSIVLLARWIWRVVAVRWYNMSWTCPTERLRRWSLPKNPFVTDIAKPRGGYTTREHAITRSYRLTSCERSLCASRDASSDNLAARGTIVLCAHYRSALFTYGRSITTPLSHDTMASTTRTPRTSAKPYPGPIPASLQRKTTYEQPLW